MFYKLLFSYDMKNAHVISIGNELLIGDTINTNASKIGNYLTESGFEVSRGFTIPDNPHIIRKQVHRSLKIADLTIVTGGLGPTHDDVTKKVVAEIFESELVEHAPVMEHIESIFKKRGFSLSASNREQAMIPQACEVLFNKMGTAPGMWFHRNGNYLALLPGVPYEMEYLMEFEVMPKIKTVFPEQDVWVTEYFKTAGIPESTLSDRVGSLEEFVANGVGIAYLPNPSGVTIRISANGNTPEAAGGKLKILRSQLNERAGDYIYGKGKNLKLAEVIGTILKEKNLSIAVAESCTGGFVANEITNIPGSSAYMKGGIIAYSNEIKIKTLSVDADDINREGAVSKTVAIQMADGVSKAFNADIGISTTGIAGPGGATPEKPVGLVWMGFSIQGYNFALKAIFTNNRLVNKERTAMVVLECIRRQLLGIQGTPYELKPHYP